MWYNFVILLCAIVNSDGARILAVFPTPSISHQVVFRPLTLELAKRGHEVVVLTTDPEFEKGKEPANFTEIDVHDISYALWREKFVVLSTGIQNDITNQVQVGSDAICDIFELQIQTKEFQAVLNDKKSFDLLLIEAWVKPALVLSHVFKVPVIQMSSLGVLAENYETMGAPTHPLLYASMFSQKINDRTFLEKLAALYLHYETAEFLNNQEKRENEMIRRNFGDDVPSLSRLKENIDMLFLNLHPIWERNRPVPPSVIFTGGLHQKPQRELPQDLKSYLDSSENGVIYMSFGTNVAPSLLPPEKIQIFVKVFSKLPYDILWKWDNENLPGRTKNIKISKWLPQSDLLRHPKVKVFITQCGLQSTDEAISAGVPLIGVPMLVDQWYNVEQYVHQKIGLRLDMETLTEEKLQEALDTILNNDSYRRNAQRLGQLMRDELQSPLSRAVWWTEYVIRHRGAKHLRSPAANITWREYLELDLALIVLLALLFTATLTLALVYFSVKTIFSLFLSPSKLKKN